MSLANKHALITGSSRGIGRAIALKLAEQGVNVAIHYYENEDAAKDTLLEVRKRGADGFLVQADVTNPEDIGHMFRRAEQEFGKLDIFVSNARPALPTFYRSPLDMTLDQWRAALDSQAQAFLLSAQQAAALMSDGGRMVSVTYSPGGRTGNWQPWAAMGTAKAAVESLCRYFAVALGPRNITVNAVSPGYVLGEPNMIEGGVIRTLPQPVQQIIQNWHEGGWTPMRRLGTPGDIANAVLLLCREEASFITGQVIHVDGGASIMDAGIPPQLQQG